MTDTILFAITVSVVCCAVLAVGARVAAGLVVLAVLFYALVVLVLLNLALVGPA